MDEIVFKHFPSIATKQWKQKIQYLLQGQNYQDLVNTTIDGVSTLPFYTKEDLKKTLPNSETPTSKPAFYCIVSDVKKANTEALKAIDLGIKVIYFAVFNPLVDLKTLLSNIDCQIIFQCYFLDNNFNSQSILKEKKCLLLNDCLNKLSKTGNWYSSSKIDFDTLQKNLIVPNNTITINLSIFHNAGASIVQQLSYAMTQLIEYSRKVKIIPEVKVTYIVSVSTDIFIEIAKIQSLRILHSIISDTISINPICDIVQQKSKRNLSGLFNDLNEANSYSERQIAVQAGVDYYLSYPINFSFYKEDIPSIENLVDQLKEVDTPVSYGSIYIEKLKQQLIDKSTLLIDTIEQGGGYIEQLKKDTIQQKITRNEIIESDKFQSKINIPDSEHSSFKHKTTISYPFLRFKKRKALWQPIIEKQLREIIERPIWEKHFNL